MFRAPEETMRQLGKNAWEVIEANWKSLLFFILSYRAGEALLIAEGGKWLTGRLLEEQGYSYLTAGNLMKFLLSPGTLAAAAAGALLLLFLLLSEVCALLACFEAGWKKENINVPELFASGLAGSAAFIRRHPVKWIPTMAACTPYLCFPAAVWEFLYGRAASAIPKHAGGIPAGTVPVLLTAVMAVSSVFASGLPARILRRDPGKQREKGAAERTAAGAFLTQAGVTAAAGASYLAAMVLVTAAVALAGDRENRVGTVMLYGNAVRSAAGAAAGAAGTCIGLLYLFLAFARQKKSACSGWRKKREPEAGKRRRISRTAVLLIFAAEAAAVLFLTEGRIFCSGAERNDIRVTAHRGGARLAPENTVSAVKSAIRSRADYAEIDVQQTEDGEIILLHDGSLERVTGIDRKAGEMSYAEIRALDAGSWFAEDFRGEKIPTLEEVMECCRGKIRLNIEIKNNGCNEDIAGRVVRIIEKQDFEEKCVVTSMNYECLERIRELNSDIITGYTMSVAYGDISGLDAADFFSVNYACLSREFVKTAHEQGKAVCVWTLNDPGEIQRAIDCGADNIITDDPELVRRIFLGGTGTEPDFLTLLGYALR